MRDFFYDTCIEEGKSLDYIGNKTLYELCEKYPYHKDRQEVFAKIWLIGRSYAAALERGKPKEKVLNDDFYEMAVERIANSPIDSLIESIRDKELIEENISSILIVYQEFHEILLKLDRGNKNSFCSKYLHFLLPKLFFIYDSRAVESISKYSDLSFYKEIKNKFKPLPYIKFFCQCFALRLKINDDEGLLLSPRQMDMILLNKANGRLRESVVNHEL